MNDGSFLLFCHVNHAFFHQTTIKHPPNHFNRTFNETVLTNLSTTQIHNAVRCKIAILLAQTLIQRKALRLITIVWKHEFILNFQPIQLFQPLSDSPLFLSSNEPKATERLIKISSWRKVYVHQKVLILRIDFFFA